MPITRQSRIPQRNLVITPLPHVAILSISVKKDVAHDEDIVCDLKLIMLAMLPSFVLETLG